MTEPSKEAREVAKAVLKEHADAYHAVVDGRTDDLSAWHEGDEAAMTAAAAIIQTALDKARTDERASKWQPIATAPKDGGWINTWDGQEVQPMCWINDTGYDPYTGWATASATWGGVLYKGYNEAETPPTHWMPLPEAPTTPAQETE